MKKFLRTFSISSFALGLTIGVIGTAVSASRAGSSVFPDVPVGSYYDSAIGEMYSLGIITGFNDGTFRPDDGLSRGQAAVLMQRLRNEVLGIEVSTSSSSTGTRRSSSSRTTTTSSSSSSSSTSSLPTATLNENGKFRFTTNTYRLEEDDGSTNVSVVRTGGKKGMVTVDYILVDATAVGDTDYEKQEGTLVFQDGETSKTFDVKIINDTDDEGNETFTLELSNATGGAEIIEPQVSVFTILDDEGASTSSAGTVSGSGPEEGTFRYSALTFIVPEDQGNSTIYVERMGGSKGAVSVKYSMTDGSASSSHYTKTSGVLNFADGETEKSFTIGVDGNTTIGGNKTVNLALSLPTGGAVLHEEQKVSVLTIFDDEIGSYGSGSFRFSANDYDVLESAGSIDIPIMRQGGASGTATIKYATDDGTARVNSDYKEAEGTLTFRDGETSKAFTVDVIKDVISDGGESVNMTISNPVGAGITSPSFSTLILY
jgi:hypothetical protein